MVNQPLHTSIEEMATAYRREIQKMQLSGPYLLGGYCLGGTIALEVAARLFEEGEDVAFLGMLDAYNWANLAPSSFFGRCLHHVQRVDFHVRNVWRLRGEDLRLFFRGKLAELRRRKAVWNNTVTPKAHSVNESAQADGSLAALWDNNERVAAEYIPAPYPGRITQFCPVRNYTELNNADVGWEELAQGGVDVHKLPVYPAGMLMEPYVGQLALKITEAIEHGLKERLAPSAAVDYARNPTAELVAVS